jgi:hypothetical protein
MGTDLPGGAGVQLGIIYLIWITYGVSCAIQITPVWEIIGNRGSDPQVDPGGAGHYRARPRLTGDRCPWRPQLKHEESVRVSGGRMYGTRWWDRRRRGWVGAQRRDSDGASRDAGPTEGRPWAPSRAPCRPCGNRAATIGPPDVPPWPCFPSASPRHRYAGNRLTKWVDAMVSTR